MSQRVTPADSRDVTAQIVRLRRVEGQVRGVQHMLEDGRSFTDIVIQLRAIAAATNRVADQLIEAHLRDLIAEARLDVGAGDAVSEVMRLLEQARRR